jgi:propanediol dehydratase small subunit
MRITRAIVLLVAVASAPALALECDNKEYSQYKDMAAEASGRYSMVRDYCAATRQREFHHKLAALAAQHGKRRDIELAQRSAEHCSTAQGKIIDALTASKALKAVQYARGGCVGNYSGKE